MKGIVGMIYGKIYISAKQAEKIAISEETTVQVRAGAKIVTSRLVISPHLESDYLLSPELKRALSIDNKKNLRVRYDAEAKMFQVGPIIGILSSFLPNQQEYDKKSVQAELIFLSNIGQKLPAHIYIFTPGGINWENNTTRAYNYQQGRWVPATYPLPDVVYDRIASRRTENRQSIRLLKKRLKALPYLKYFNPSYLNKWSVYQILSQNPDLIPFLPETKLLTTDNLQSMLLKYKTLYVKPSQGTKGVGIIMVEQRNQQLFYTIYYKKGRIHGNAGSAEEFMRKTRAVRGKKAYIVQEGIPLATYRGSPFDIRVIYQKDGTGEWVITKEFVRVAPHGSSIANLSCGGQFELSRKVFRKLYQKRDIINAKNAAIKQLCHLIATTLESNSSGIYGELGLDLGLDNQGKLWLIEVNSKPRKTTRSVFSMAVVRNTFRRPLEYAIYLSGFSNKEGTH